MARARPGRFDVVTASACNYLRESGGRASAGRDWPQINFAASTMRTHTSAVVAAVRSIGLAALQGNSADAREICRSMYGASHPGFALLQKAAVPAGGTTGDAGGLTSESEEVAAFMRETEELTLLGRLRGVVQVAATQPYAAATQRLTGYWLGEQKAVKVSPLAFDRKTLKPLKVAALVAMSEELLEDSDPRADGILRAMLQAAIQRATDTAFIDSTNAGSATKPAAVTYGARSFVSSGNLEDDLQRAIFNFAGNWATAAWILSPADAALIALKDAGNGAARGLGALGGELVGLPAFTSEGVPTGQLSLVDASGVAVCDEGVSFAAATDASIELDDAPTGAGDTPTAASARLANLFQSDIVALRARRRLNWACPDRAAGRIVTVTGADYLAS